MEAFNSLAKSLDEDQCTSKVNYQCLTGTVWKYGNWKGNGLPTEIKVDMTVKRQIHKKDNHSKALSNSSRLLFIQSTQAVHPHMVWFNSNMTLMNSFTFT